MSKNSFFESVEQHFNIKLPFVVYRKPNSKEVKTILQQSDTLYKSADYSESGFIFAPFDDVEHSVVIPLSDSKVYAEELSLEGISLLQTQFTNNKEEKEAHINLVQKGIEAIERGDFSKVVLSRCEKVSNFNKNPFKIFESLMATYESAFIYLWFHPQVGLWLGATPETLLKVENHRIFTMSLAGTQVYSGQDEVKWKDKEIEEQRIVTSTIINALEPLTKSLDVSRPLTVRAGNLLHLRTNIHGVLNQNNLGELLDSLHPTPAVCGYPKLSSKAFILEHENYKREFYTGFLGELNIVELQARNRNSRNVENNAYKSVKKTSDLYVNLRCVQIKENKAMVYVGGGITKDSNPVQEWEETVSKTTTIKCCL